MRFALLSSILRPGYIRGAVHIPVDAAEAKEAHRSRGSFRFRWAFDALIEDTS